MEATRVTFKKGQASEFHSVVKARVEQYLRSNGHRKHGHWTLYLKTCVFLTVMSACYGLILSNLLSGPATLLLALGFGLASVFLVFTTAHDATHGTYSRNRTINAIAKYAWNLVGISSYTWTHKHNITHHVFTNVMGTDYDIHGGGILRLHPNDPLKPHHRYQHLYAPILYSLLSMLIIFNRDFEWQRKTDWGNRRLDEHPTSSWVILYLTKVLYLTYSLVIPMLVLDFAWWQILGGYVLMHQVIGLVMTFILLTVHITHGARYVTPNDDGHVDSDWAIHQVETTVDIAAESRIVNWFTGGLNTHVAHHLFPRVCHAHMFQITRIIKATAAEHGVSYLNRPLIPGLWAHLSFLRALGREVDPTARPAAAEVQVLGQPSERVPVAV